MHSKSYWYFVTLCKIAPYRNSLTDLLTYTAVSRILSICSAFLFNFRTVGSKLEWILYWEVPKYVTFLIFPCFPGFPSCKHPVYCFDATLLEYSDSMQFSLVCSNQNVGVMQMRCKCDANVKSVLCRENIAVSQCGSIIDITVYVRRACRFLDVVYKLSHLLEVCCIFGHFACIFGYKLLVFYLLFRIS